MTALAMKLVPLLLIAWATSAVGAASAEPVTIGSKSFTESVVLGELAAGLAREAGVEARHRRELGGTRIVWSALTGGEIDAYIEYTGTLRREILAGATLDDRAALRAALAERGVRMSAPLGFENTYALGMRAERARTLGIETISDLRAHSDLVFGFSNEFMDREDGWPGLRRRYDLSPRRVRGLDHDLAYRALAQGQIDVTDLYTTDAEIRYYDLTLLRDDRSYFPEYEAVLLYRADLAERAPGALRSMRRLEGELDAATVIDLNARVKLEGVPETRAAGELLDRRFGLATPTEAAGAGARLVSRGLEHLYLVAVSLGGAIVLAVPLGIAAARQPRVGQALLGIVGVVQTVPPLALLVFMIPLLGIGSAPAIAALFVYSLLPVVRNTHAGLTGIDPALRESAAALGLPPRARLARVELPVAMPAILAGIQTSAVINVGTATLGALIGAGGYGQPILTGIRLDDVGLILQGAVPAAALALFVQGIFELVARWLIPRGLRLAGETR